MNPLAQNFLARVRDGVSNSSSLDKIPEWMCANTRDPMDPDKNWSFKDHEYQVEILRDDCNRLSARKCSQVGASEMFTRMALGMVAVKKALTAIYILPTKGMANNFAKSRLDPVIANSKLLSSMSNGDVDSSGLKQFANSFLYIVGSYGQSAAISVPAQALLKDEVDFCNQAVLTMFNSRLGHAKDGGLIREFSTPTVFGYGIDLAFQQSSQGWYGVKCASCFEYVAPDFMQDVEIPGFDGGIAQFEKEDLYDERVNVDAAFIRCPSCHAPIDWMDMCNPEMRTWMHKHPDRTHHRGYQIQPFDVPKINTVVRTLKQIADYERKKDWVNMKVGQPFEDAETAFISELIKANTYDVQVSAPIGTELNLVTKVADGCVMGVDVGKTSWAIIGRPMDGKVKIIYKERIKQDGNNYLLKRIIFLSHCFGVIRGVIDAGPDFTTSKSLVESLDTWWACYYQKDNAKVLENVILKPEERMISAYRTRCFDELVKRANSGFYHYTSSPDSQLFSDHLCAMKRVETENDVGEKHILWHSTGDDHYAHALNYMNMAYNMVAEYAKYAGAPSLPMVGKVRLKDGFENEANKAKMKRYFLS